MPAPLALAVSEGVPEADGVEDALAVPDDDGDELIVDVVLAV